MEYLTVSEAAEALQLSVPTVKRYIYEGKLESTKLPGGQHRIPQAEIDRLLGGNGGSHEDAGRPSHDDRLAVLERWVTDLQAEVERLSATIEVMSRYCGQMGGGSADRVADGDEVLVLGPGCKRCNALYELTQRVMGSLGRGDMPVRHVKDLDDIASYGPVVTPALVVGGKVVVSGRIPTETALRNLLERELT